MRSECQFFMAKEDEVAFLRFAEEKCGLSLHDQWLKSSRCPAGGIQFLPSKKFGEELTAGRIALATADLGGISTEAPELEKIYRALRRYIQKNFSNKLAAYTDGQKSKYTYRDLWLGPCAQAWLSTTSGGVLRQGKGFSSNFIPEVGSNADA
jgi:hypothetical protein